MALHHNPRIVTDGLVLALDAADTNSYPGSGTTWYDLSGNDNHVSMNNSVINSVWSNGAFPLNGSYGFTSTDPPTREQYCTVVMVYKTSDTQELWVRGQSGSYYIAASNNNNYYI